LYPRTYSVPAKIQFYLTFWFILAAGSTILLWRLHVLAYSPKAPIIALVALLLGGCLLEVLTLKVILEPEAVTVRYAFSTRRLLRQEIAGWRAGVEGRGTGTSARTLVPKDDSKKTVSFPEVKTDGAFFAWFAGLPQLQPGSIPMDTPPQMSLAKGARLAVGALVVLMGTLLFYFNFIDGRPYENQTMALITDTEFVFFCVFFDTRMGRGYSLRNKIVQRQLPQLLQVHCVFLALLFALITFAPSARPHLPHSWLVDPGYRYTMSPFESVLVLVGIAIVLTEVWISRKLLSRALESAAISPKA
jgi:hypothetical protein